MFSLCVYSLHSGAKRLILAAFGLGWFKYYRGVGPSRYLVWIKISRVGHSVFVGPAQWHCGSSKSIVWVIQLVEHHLIVWVQQESSCGSLNVGPSSPRSIKICGSSITLWLKWFFTSPIASVAVFCPQRKQKFTSTQIPMWKMRLR